MFMIKGGNYLLYLDECIFTEKDTNNKVYGIAGVAVHESNLISMRKEIGQLKIKLWGKKIKYAQAKNIILHSAEIRKAKVDKIPEYEIFNKRSNVREVFLGIENIITNNKLVVFGSVVNLGNIETKYKTFLGSSHYIGDFMCMNEIINNFNCFLKWHNAKGKIIFESRSSKDNYLADDKLRKQYYKIMTHGTMIYKALDLQRNIEGINFIKKQENEAGLQIADFVVQPFLMNFCGEPQSKPNIYRTLKKHRYSGFETFGEKNSKIFGVSYLR
ncbi:DUF3800 domain-containing protein [Enterococcus faecium]|nr:DUF3800 domain-containing protein [Enterococcus faecium]